MRTTTTADFIAAYRTARQQGVPLVGIQTPDPQATMERLKNNSDPSTPLIGWDVCQGWRGLNKAGLAAIIAALATDDPEEIAAATGQPVEMLIGPAVKLRGYDPVEDALGSVLFLQNAHRYLSDDTPSGAAFVQAVWNLRDRYKADGRTLVIMGPSLTMPAELGTDVLVLDEPLPDDGELETIVREVCKAGEVVIEDAGPAIDALRGLPSFSAEQAVALSLIDGTLDRGALWERKRQMIAATPGLSVYQGGETLDDVGGCEAIKALLRAEAKGREPFRCVYFNDEIEKMLGGAIDGAGDGGVSKDALQVHLTEMQAFLKTGSTGALLVGPPGAAKSFIAQTVGASAGVPTIVADYSGGKNSLVGKSEANFRAMFKTLWAVSGGRVLFLATCNKQVDIPPEVKRRYSAGIWFFDLPTPEEQEVIWRMKLKKYGHDLKAKRPPYPGWTGYEIETCCHTAWRLNISLERAADYIVPVAKSAAKEIEALRTQADGRWLSASKPGVYRRSPEVEAPPTERAGRRLGSRERV